MNQNKILFKTTAEMPYANNEQIREKAEHLFKKLQEHLKSIKKHDVSFTQGYTVYIPDIHGDFVHLIITLYKHWLVDEDLNLKKDFQYLFLGDFYDRAPDSDVIDFWLNTQIRNDLNIYRLIGNHEMAFFERDPNGYPLLFPSHDSIKDIENGFIITENILKNIADGTILACYVGDDNRRGVACNASTTAKMLYAHSYITNDDYEELGLRTNTDVSVFAFSLNERLKTLGQYSFDLFKECKKLGKYNWKNIMKPFNDDPLFNIYNEKNDISTSFIWRRTALPTLKIFPAELDVNIPDNVYQIVGHTPVFSFALPNKQPTNKPFILRAKNGTGIVQFSDVGMGYYYKSDSFERPEVFIEQNISLNV